MQLTFGLLACLLGLDSFMEGDTYTGWPVVTTTDTRYVVGYITRSEIRQALGKASLSSIVHYTGLYDW
jgi:hypothetical protein